MNQGIPSCDKAVTRGLKQTWSHVLGTPPYGLGQEAGLSHECRGKTVCFAQTDIRNALMPSLDIYNLGSKTPKIFFLKNRK
jgi:hypothetical protein